MIGQQGWVVSFTIEGNGQEQMQERILQRLHTFWPPDETSGWRIDVDAYPIMQQDHGATTEIVRTWTGEVKAQRVVVASPTDHRSVDGHGQPIEGSEVIR